jgi:hypothetical protein
MEKKLNFNWITLLDFFDDISLNTLGQVIYKDKAKDMGFKAAYNLYQSA